MRRYTDGKRAGGFSLIELLVVIGIIALLISMLMPSLSKARQQANRVACESNLRQVGQALLIYANNWKGWMYPPNLGADHSKPLDWRWPVHVFNPPVWNPKVMTCPADFQPAAEHSYVLNDHLFVDKIKFNSRIPNGVPSSDVILMGEKRATEEDYYMNVRDYDRVVQPYMHGVQQGSNYLFLDLHVGMLKSERTLQLLGITDPWDLNADPDNPEDPTNNPAAG